MPTTRLLTNQDIGAMHALLDLYAEAFDDDNAYLAARPSNKYLRDILDSQDFVTLVAEEAGIVVGGLSGYTLRKYERERSEVYIYDLAVSARFRRKGIATGLIEELKRVAQRLGISGIFVQASHEDLPAVALYETLGSRAEVAHFDISIDTANAG